jgi:hypothetical protein
MTAPTMAAPSGAGSAAAPAAKTTGKAPAAPPRPFVAGTRRVDKCTYDVTVSTTTSTQDLTTFEFDPNGFLSGGYILVEALTAGNSATVTFSPDGPFDAIDTVTLNDTNNKPIVGPLGGHDLYVLNKYGGYEFIDDAKQSPIYVVTTGAGSTGGSFTFCLLLPVEIVHRDALGALPNKSSSATFNVRIRIAATATIYGTAPTTAPSVRTRIQQFGWMDPNATDMRGNPVSQNPPGVQTTQYWNKQTYTLNSGAFSQKLQGIDSLLRNLIFELRDSSNSRQQGDSDFPDPFTMTYETSLPIQRVRTIWRDMVFREFGYAAAFETAGGRDYGVYPEPYNRDFMGKPGQETRLGYLPASSSTTINAQGTIGGSGVHTLVLLVNKIVPAGGDPMVLTGR